MHRCLPWTLLVLLACATDEQMLVPADPPEWPMSNATPPSKAPDGEGADEAAQEAAPPAEGAEEGVEDEVPQDEPTEQEQDASTDEQPSPQPDEATDAPEADEGGMPNSE